MAMFRLIVFLMCTLTMVSALGLSQRSKMGLAIARSRGEAQVGDLIIFYLSHPEAGVVVGSTELTQVGSMDFFGKELWAASGRDDKLRFYTIDWNTGRSTLQSTFEGRFTDGVSAGSFDSEGAYWVMDMRHHNLFRIDPTTGKLLHSAKIPTSAGYNGIAFVEDTLFAVRGGTGDPPQEFGTIDPETGEFTRIGYTRVGFEGKGGGNGCGALDYDAPTDTLYLVYRQGAQKPQRWSLYTIDFETGKATFVSEIKPKSTYDAFAVMP